MRLLAPPGHGRAQPDVRRLLRHCIEILSMPRIIVALGVRRVILAIGMITIHEPSVRRTDSLLNNTLV
jgi:hypothetical protein